MSKDRKLVALIECHSMIVSGYSTGTLKFFDILFSSADLDFTFLEMNPFTLVNGEPFPLDMRGELDDTAAFKNFNKYSSVVDSKISYLYLFVTILLVTMLHILTFLLTFMCNVIQMG